MRLISALYNSFYPFDSLNNVANTEVATNEDFVLEQGDVLIVWGGADIPTQYYNKGRSSYSGAPVVPGYRDRVEWALMQQAKEKNIPIIGVCRGAQMLCALSGGKLYQHVDNHSGGHEVVTADGVKFTTNSIHHQMMEPDGTNHELIAWTPIRSGKYIDVADGIDINREAPSTKVDTEFIYFKDTKGFAIQWHPEMMRWNSDATQYVLNYINNHA